VAIENKALVLDLVEWIAEGPRPYREAMDAWRTSCPRLPVWEDAIEHGLIRCVENGGGLQVVVTSEGAAFVSAERDGKTSP
jgi:hypothetical protein